MAPMKNLKIREVSDTVADNIAIRTLIVSDGTLTDNGDGSATVTIAAGSSLTVEEVDGSPTDSAITKIKFPNGTLGIASHVATYTPASAGYTQGCRVYHNATQTTSNGTLLAIAFNSELYDTDTMHDPSTNNSRITFTTAGKYNVGGGIRHDVNSAYDLAIRLNGTTYIVYHKRASNGTATQIESINTDYSFSASDYVELVIIPTTGGAGALDMTLSYTGFWAQRIG